MNSPVSDAIRERLAAYLAGRTSVADFDAWFVPATWELRPEDDPEAHDLANEIFLRLAEYGQGHRTEPDLKALLRPLVEAPVGAR